MIAIANKRRIKRYALTVWSLTWITLFAAVMFSVFMFASAFQYVGSFCKYVVKAFAGAL